MARLPKPGQDAGQWGDILNDYLSQSHNTDGTLKTDSVTAAQLASGSVKSTTIADGAITTTKLADTSITNAQLDATTKASLAKADSSVQPGDIDNAVNIQTYYHVYNSVRIEINESR